jgi:hypothetical protein
MQASFLPSGPSSKPTAPEGFEFVGGRPCGRMYFSPVGGRPCGRMCFSLVGGRPCGRMCLSPVGGCPCGRMIAVAPANIREQGLAPTWTLLLQEFFGRLLFREFSGRPPLRPNVLLPCGRPPLRPNDCSGSGQHSRAGARSHIDTAFAGILWEATLSGVQWEAAPAAECASSLWEAAPAAECASPLWEAAPAAE